MKIRAYIRLLLILPVLVLCTLTIHANSAMTKWTGTDTSGVISSDKDCPLVIEKEDLTFEIPAFPVIGNTGNPIPMSSVTASYTFRNPSDLHIKARLAFPFGKAPSYGGGGFGLSPEEYRKAELDTYRITLNDREIEPVLRHTWMGWNSFDLNEDLSRLSEDGTESFWKRDLPVTVYTYDIQDIDLETYSAAAARTSLKADPAETRYIVFPFNGGRMSGNEADIKLWADAGDFRIIVFGKDTGPQTEWTFTETGDSDKEIEGTVSLRSAESSTFREFVMNYYKEDSGIREDDYLNAYADMLDNSMACDILAEPGTLSLEEQYLMRWYEYEIELDPGETAVNSVTAPLFPAVDTAYDSPVYEYTYLLSPASTWKEFKDLTVRVHTPYTCIGTAPSELFDKTGDGYEAHFDTLPDHELVFRLCEIENPKKGLDTGWLYALIFIVPVVLVFILFFALLVFILKKIFRRRS